MQNENSAITEAAKGIGEKVAVLWGTSVSRFYQTLEADHYNKIKRLIRCIAAVDKERIRIIKADLDALFAELLGEEKRRIDGATVHKEAFEFVQAVIKDDSPAVIAKEGRELIAVVENVVSDLDETKGEIYRQNFGDLEQ